jgi:hypothetical protein
LQEISYDDDKEDEEKGSEGSKEIKVDGSSSSSSGSGTGAREDDDVEDDDGHDVLENPHPIESVELRLQGGGVKEEQDIESCPTEAGLMPHRRHVHIIREGCEVATDEDEPGASFGKYALSDVSRSGLRHLPSPIALMS